MPEHPDDAHAHLHEIDLDVPGGALKVGRGGDAPRRLLVSEEWTPGEQLRWDPTAQHVPGMAFVHLRDDGDVARRSEDIFTLRTRLLDHIYANPDAQHVSELAQYVRVVRNRLYGSHLILRPLAYPQVGSEDDDALWMIRPLSWQGCIERDPALVAELQEWAQGESLDSCPMRFVFEACEYRHAKLAGVPRSIVERSVLADPVFGNAQKIAVAIDQGFRSTSPAWLNQRYQEQVPPSCEVTQPILPGPMDVPELLRTFETSEAGTVVRFRRSGDSYDLEQPGGTYDPGDVWGLEGDAWDEWGTQRSEEINDLRVPEFDGADALIGIVNDGIFAPLLREPFDGLFVDTDGTIIDNYDDPTMPLARRLHALSSAGVPIAVASGRNGHDTARYLRKASAYPTVTIYGRNGAQVLVPDGDEWVELRTPGLVGAVGATEFSAERQQEVDALFEQVKTILARDPLLTRGILKPERVKKYGEFCTISIPYVLRSMAPEGPTSLAYSRLIEETLLRDPRFTLPDWLQFRHGASAVQIVPSFLGKRRCLDDAAARWGIDPEQSRILRIGDQALPGEHVQVRGRTHLVGVGSDAEVVCHRHGLTSMNGGALPLRLTKNGPQETLTRATAWYVDRASFRLARPWST